MRIVVAFVALGLLACQTARPVSAVYSLRKEAGAECASHCGDLGMNMSAVVIIADMTGCVCEPKGRSQASAGGAAAASGGAVAAILAAQQQQAAAQQQQQHH